MIKIPFSKPDIIDSDIKRLNDAIRSGWLAHGKNSHLFEKIFCKYTKTSFGYFR